MRLKIINVNACFYCKNRREKDLSVLEAPVHWGCEWVAGKPAPQIDNLNEPVHQRQPAPNSCKSLTDCDKGFHWSLKCVTK